LFGGDLLGNWTFYIAIAVIVVIIAVAAVLVLRRKKTKTQPNSIMRVLGKQSPVNKSYNVFKSNNHEGLL